MKSFKIIQSITNKDDVSIKNYLKDISKIPLLTKEKELELGKIIQQGLSENATKEEKIKADKARNKLVGSNLRFVVSVAKQYRNQGLPFVDLINEGNLGMIQAAEKFDWTKGYKFISYAVWWIRQSIIQAIALKSRTIKVPMNQTISLAKLNSESEKFEQLNDRKPSFNELSLLTGVSVDKIIKIYSYNTNCVSVDTHFTTDEDSGCLLDVVKNPNSESSDNNLINDSLKYEIKLLLNKLTPKQRVVLQMIFGIDCDPMQLDQISIKFGVTSERIRQIKESALKEIHSKYMNYVKRI